MRILCHQPLALLLSLFVYIIIRIKEESSLFACSFSKVKNSSPSVGFAVGVVVGAFDASGSTDASGSSDAASVGAGVEFGGGGLSGTQAKVTSNVFVFFKVEHKCF
jgi:hypothetical protein